MTQNTEQNMRTRREQLSTYPESVCVGRYSDGSWQLRRDGDHLDGDRLIEGPVLYVRCDIAHQSQAEAEARGAEEQRRKDAEGQEAIYQYQYSDQSWCDTSQEEYERNTALDPNDTRILYTRPANVATLKARIEAMTFSLAQSYGIRGEKQKRINEVEAEIASLKEAEQLARADAEASKANAGWNFLTENVSSDPELPRCRLNRMFQEWDSSERIEETLAAFGIEACWDATEWDWQAPPEEMEELSANDLEKCDPRKDLTDAGWKLVDAWDTEDGEIVRMYARPISAALTREGGV